MKSLTIGIAYYRNPKTLEYVFDKLKQYDKSVCERLEVIVVDDGSNLGLRAEELPFWKEPLPFKASLCRIIPDLAWNHRGAHNLAAHLCSSEWFIYHDVDHFFPAHEMSKLMDIEPNKDFIYSFGRIQVLGDAFNNPHKETRLISKELFWKIGGFDETFSGIYAFPEWEFFEERIKGKFEQVQLPVNLYRITMEIVDDCITKGLIRKEGRDNLDFEKIISWKKANNVGIQTLRLPWVKIF